MTKPWSPFTITDPFDDDDLEDLQRILWRGYVPKPYPRHDWHVVAPGLSLPPPYRKPKKRPKTVLQYSVFRCDGCEQTFRSIIPEEEADKAYHETFGPAATEERLALCEDCYNRAMEEFLK